MHANENKQCAIFCIRISVTHYMYVRFGKHLQCCSSTCCAGHSAGGRCRQVLGQSIMSILSAIQVFRLYFTTRCTIVVQSTVLRLRVVRLSVCPLLWRAYRNALTDCTIPDHLCPLSLDWRAPKTPIAIISFRTHRAVIFAIARLSCVTYRRIVFHLQYIQVNIHM